MISTSNLNKIKPKKTAISLSLIILFGLAIRFYFVPTDLPIVSDGFFDFVYAAKTVFEGGLPIGYGTTNTGWANFLSLFFSVSDTSDPFYLMEIQRSLSIILSTIIIIPAFFIFRRFVDTRWAIFGSVLLIMEPRLLMMSLEGINYSLFFFLFVLTIALFLKKTDNSLFLSFACIACATLVRYEGLLLLIPLSIMYFLKFKDKRSIARFLGMIFVLIIILVPIASIRMEATENLCYETYFGIICGQDGFSPNILGAMQFIEKYVISDWTPATDVKRLVIDTAGQIGIGIYSPAAKVHIVNDADASNNCIGLYIDQNDTGNWGASIDAVGYGMQITGPTWGLRVTSGQSTFACNVGIGTESPTGTLHVNSGTTASATTLKIRSAGTSGAAYGMDINVTGSSSGINVGGFFYAINGTGNRGIEISGTPAATTNYALYSSAAAQSYFAGNVGIGCTGPGHKLTVAGTGMFRVADTAALCTLTTTTDRTAVIRPLHVYRNTGSAPYNTSGVGILLRGEDYGSALRCLTKWPIH